MGGTGAFVKLLQDSVLKEQTVSLTSAMQFAVKEEERRVEKREQMQENHEN